MNNGKWILSLLLTMALAFGAAAGMAQGTVIEPCPEEIETLWDLEDQRQESETPLVSALYNGEDKLGYDSESTTFYCTLGMETEEWPELNICAAEDNVHLVWSDDYSWDGVKDAIRDGTAYEAVAYTDDSYQVIYIVFTGLPMIVIDADASTQIDVDYVPCTAHFASAGYDAIHSDALVHLRSGGFPNEYQKKSYRLELHRTTEKGKDKKNKVSVFGMEKDSDWLLISSAADQTCVRNYMGWQLWNNWHDEGEVYPAPLKCQLVEVFVQNEYKGIYQLQQRIKPEREIERIGGNLDTDMEFRIIREPNIGKRTVVKMTDPHNRILELRYKPETMSEEEAFSYTEDFFYKLETPGALTDEEFAKMVEEKVNIRDVISYFLFMQAASLPLDNVENNTYLWVVKDENGNYTYSASPWDMDMAFIPVFKDPTLVVNMWMELPARMLNLNVGNCREILWEIWDEKQATIISEDSLYVWFLETQNLLNDSGAYRRETEKWYGGAVDSDLREVMGITTQHIDNVLNSMQQTWPRDGMEPAEVVDTVTTDEGQEGTENGAA